MREPVLHLSGYRYRNLYGQSYTVKQNIIIATCRPDRPRRQQQDRDHASSDDANYPTLAECYKTAGFNGINRLSA